jgi:hypothetical protein
MDAAEPRSFEHFQSSTVTVMLACTNLTIIRFTPNFIRFMLALGLRDLERRQLGPPLQPLVGIVGLYLTRMNMQ